MNTQSEDRPRETLPANCPPPDAIDANGVFFACHLHNPPSRQDDFLTSAERGLHPKRDPCQRCGLSVCTNVEDAREIVKRFPRGFKHVSRGLLVPGHGKTKKTEGPVPSHHTFWKADFVTFHDIFTQLA